MDERLFAATGSLRNLAGIAVKRLGGWGTESKWQGPYSIRWLLCVTTAGIKTKEIYKGRGELNRKPLVLRLRLGDDWRKPMALVQGLDAVVAWSMRLTDKPLPKGSISHIWHPDREIEGQGGDWRAGTDTQFMPIFLLFMTYPNMMWKLAGHSNMVPEAVQVMNECVAELWETWLVPCWCLDNPSTGAACTVTSR